MTRYEKALANGVDGFARLLAEQKIVSMADACKGIGIDMDNFTMSMENFQHEVDAYRSNLTLEDCPFMELLDSYGVHGIDFFASLLALERFNNMNIIFMECIGKEAEKSDELMDDLANRFYYFLMEEV